MIRKHGLTILLVIVFIAFAIVWILVPFHLDGRI